MIGANGLDKEKILKGAFDSGFEHATKAFGQLTGEKIKFMNVQVGSIALNDDSRYSYDTSSDYLLLTTKICGEITGKSYFILSEVDYELITKRIPGSQATNADLKEEFIKELNNILSASVITKLSNELDQHMYGDVPVFLGRVRARIGDIILDDFCEYEEVVYVNIIHFSFDDYPNSFPAFIWVIDSHSQKKM